MKKESKSVAPILINPIEIIQDDVYYNGIRWLDKLGDKETEIKIPVGHTFEPFLPKKLYVLMACVDHDGCNPIGIYTTLEAVEKAERLAEKSSYNGVDNYAYMEVDLIE